MDVSSSAPFLSSKRHSPASACLSVFGHSSVHQAASLPEQEDSNAAVIAKAVTAVGFFID